MNRCPGTRGRAIGTQATENTELAPRNATTDPFTTIINNNIESIMPLTGYRALVCGASKGIGRASAERLAQLGASVTTLARTESALADVIATLDTSKGQVHSMVVADVTRPDELVHSVQNHVDNVGAIHICVNNTAGPAGGKLIDAKPEQLLEAFSNHILIAHRLTSVLVPGMKAAGYGRIVNIISTSVKQPIEGLGVSNTIRGAMASWSKTLATELAPYGITVTNVLPGATETERLTQIIDRKAEGARIAVDDVRQEMLDEIPAGRFARPEEIANAVGFLALPMSGYITGTSILVDGGRTRALS